jgi:Fe-coproporphyrin III synthase
MLKEVTGIRRVRMLYVQLQYGCNFRCKHCFHGQLLESSLRYSCTDAIALIEHFRTEYALEAVTLLGGEPLLYPDIVAVAEHCKHSGLTVEICTNGHRGFFDVIRKLAPFLDKFRVSIDGLVGTHDQIRQRGSFASALDALDLAAELGLSTGATMTVTSTNISEVVPLARVLDEHGIEEIKLHCLRLVGNAAQNPELAVAEQNSYGVLHQEIAEAGLKLDVIYDSDLTPEPTGETCANLIDSDYLDRIEADPRGGLTVSCKAVGRDVNAFSWDFDSGIVYKPRATDELAVPIADVVYVNA